MFKKIYKAIKKYDTIVISRHIGVDPDAMGSQIALRDAILETFPSKKVTAVGNGTTKFTYLGKLDKLEDNYEDALLIVLDTPDKKRVDGVEPSNFSYTIKIDHHPYVETFCDLEYIDDTASSTCQLIIEMLYKTKLKSNKKIMEKLFIGLISDTNRFLFKNSTAETFEVVGRIVKDYDLSITELYEKLYMRHMNEVRLQGYISQNMIITDHGVGYIIITNDIINKFQVDVGSAGNMANQFNNIEEILVWATISEDKKNDLFKINIRSRGPIINKIAEEYRGGGHQLASGARVTSLEEAELLIKALDRTCEKYIEEETDYEN